MISLVKMMFLMTIITQAYIITIKQHITDKNKAFSFRKVTKEEISSAIKTLNRKKVTLYNDIPTKIIQREI